MKLEKYINRCTSPQIAYRKLGKWGIMCFVGASLVLTGCNKLLNLEPLDAVTEAIYFRTPAHFAAASNLLHRNMYAWDSYDAFDAGSDITGANGDYGAGLVVPTPTNDHWKKPYEWLRDVNILIRKANEYPGAQSEIAGSVGQAYFFRAWHHFYLMRLFGGVPLALTDLNVDSPELFAARASRYQVVEQIVADLDESIRLLGEASVTAPSVSYDGHVTLETAQAFKARVCLYEATWEKYVGQSTDGDGAESGAGQAGFVEGKATEYLTMARDMSKAVIESGNFELWKGVESVSVLPNAERYDNTSYFYLFNLEDAASNPAGRDKASNREAIFRTVFDFVSRRGGINISHSKMASPTRKMMDMYLCVDGLPIQYSPLFEGYANAMDEFENRDSRMTSTVQMPFLPYWGWGSGMGAQYQLDINTLGISYVFVPTARGTGTGYVSRKFVTEHRARETNQESADRYHIRLAEIYLIYAEAVCELGNGAISDADLNYSINVVRERAGVAPLTNSLIAPYTDLTLLGEIRRERALELHGEGLRFSDVCRWGIAEGELNHAKAGIYVDYNGVPTAYKTAINPRDQQPIFNANAYGPSLITSDETSVSSYAGIAKTKPGAIISERAQSRNFQRRNYLLPLPTDQITLNTKLLQNPGY